MFCLYFSSLKSEGAVDGLGLAAVQGREFEPDSVGELARNAVDVLQPHPVLLARDAKSSDIVLQIQPWRLTLWPSKQVLTSHPR